MSDTPLWVQFWEESEAGWGTRPDGYTLHVRVEDIDAFLKVMRDGEYETYKGAVPPEYSRPSGAPRQGVIADADLDARVRASKCGIWGPGNAPVFKAEEPAP